MFGLFKKFKDGFSKTVSAIEDKTAAIFGQKPIDASSLDSLEEALYTADFGVETTQEILEEIKRAHKKEKELRGQVKSGSTRKAAEIVGQRIAAKAKEKGIEKVAFDRAGYRYHGRVKALADAARAGGLKF